MICTNQGRHPQGCTQSILTSRELLMWNVIWIPLLGEVGLYFNDVWMVLWAFTKTGSTTKMDLAIFLANFGLVWTWSIVFQPLGKMYWELILKRSKTSQLMRFTNHFLWEMKARLTFWMLVLFQVNNTSINDFDHKGNPISYKPFQSLL